MAVLPLVLYHRISPATLTEIMNTVTSRMSSGEKAGYAATSAITGAAAAVFRGQFFNRSPIKKL